MKKHIIVFTLFLLNALTSYSQELSGVYWNGTEEIFTSLDISTGTFTDLAILPNVQTIYSSNTFNSSNNHYAITTDLGITIINALDGTILNTITNTVFWTGMEFNQTIPLSVNNYSTIRLDVYPNPVTNFLHIHSNIKNLNIQLINSFGQIVFTSKYSETDYIKFDLSKFSSGLYFLKINEHTFKKIIKK